MASAIGQPGTPEFDVAVEHFHAGRLDTAQHHFSNYLDAVEECAVTVHYLGKIAARLGNPDLALRRMQAAHQLAPNDGVILAHYAEALKNVGRLDEALSSGREAVRIAPDSGEVHNCLGLVFLARNNLEMATRAFANATRLNPKIGGFWNNLGTALRDSGVLDEAAEASRKAVRLCPDNPRFTSNLAAILVDSSRHSDALQTYEASNRIEERAETWNHIGQIRNELGEKSSAADAFRKSLEMDAEFGPAYVNLAIHHEAEFTAELESRMCRLLEGHERPLNQKAAMNYALARVADRRKLYPLAANHIKEANSLQHRWHCSLNQPYSREAHERRIDGVIKTHTPELLDEMARYGHRSRRPVFIIGLPRSGTTLLEQILACHPAVFGAGELRLASQSFDAATVKGNRLEQIGSLSPDQVLEHAERHLKELARLDDVARHVVDKMPENYVYVGWLKMQFPNAKFVRCVRDPRDIAVSCLITSFRHVKWSNCEDDIVHRFRAYRRIIDHWNQVLPGLILDVRYEDLVGTNRTAVERALEWLGLPWDDACLDHTLVERPIRTASVSQVRKPLYGSSIGRWKNYRSEFDGLFDRLDDIESVYD